MSKKRKVKIPLWLIIVLAEVIVCVILFACGFKVVYAPELTNDWEAIGAIGTWVCGLVVPFALIIFERKLSASEKRVSSSNLATLEELNEFKKKYEPLLKAFTEGEVDFDCGGAPEDCATDIPSQHEIYRFICISMIVSSKDIAAHFGVEVESLRNRIEDMWAVQGLISPSTLSDDPVRDFANCQWQKSK